MDDRFVILFPADNGLNTSGGQTSVRIQFLAGNGIVSRNADAFRDIKIQDEVVVKIEIVDLYIE